MKKVKKYYEGKRPKSVIRNIQLLHVNVPAHKSLFGKKKVEVFLPHPPYSADLPPCDLFLFFIHKSTCLEKDRLQGML